MPGKSRKFKFKGYDQNDEPIVMTNDNRRITGQAEMPEVSEDDLVMKVYSVNPTWVNIGGRWYRIG